MNEHLYQAADKLRHLYWRVAKPTTHGVKVFALHPDFDSVLLIRNSYGDKSLYTLPGGSIKRNESVEQAAARELYEEVGLEFDDAFQLGEDYINTAEHKIDTVTTIGARVTSYTLSPNREIAEAKWWNIDAIDEIEPVSKFVLRAIADYRTKND